MQQLPLSCGTRRRAPTLWAGALLLGMPVPALASGGGVVLLLPCALLLLSATPVLDLLRRRAWAMAWLYAVALPMLWALSAGAGYAAGQLVHTLAPRLLVTVSLAVGVLTLGSCCWLCWRDLLARHRRALPGQSAVSTPPAVSLLAAARWLLALVVVCHGLLVLRAQVNLWLALSASPGFTLSGAPWSGLLAALLQLSTGVLLWARHRMVVVALVAWALVVCRPLVADPAHWSAAAALQVSSLAELLAIVLLLALMWVRRRLPGRTLGVGVSPASGAAGDAPRAAGRRPQR